MRSSRRFRHWFVLVILVLVFSGLETQTSLGAQVSPYIEGKDAAAPFFDPTVVNRVDLIVPLSSIQIMNNEFPIEYEGMWTRPTNFTYVPAQIKITTATATYGPLDVEIHLKGGWGSLRSLSDKAGFKVKINSTGHKTQRILGLKKLTFNNNVQDGSYTHEVNAYRVFRNVGVPAPRVGYVRVYMNCPDSGLSPDPATSCVDYGLHTNIETMDDVALARWTTGTTHLYEGGTPTFPDATLDRISGFPIADLGNNADRSDLSSLSQINELNGAEWFEQIQKKTNLEELTLEWATEAFVGHWDGYANNRNNFYLHSDANGVFQMYPWGTDQTWGSWANDLFSFQAAMPTKCLAYAPCRDIYSKSLVKVWATANKLKLPNMTVDIYQGLWATNLGPQTDPYSQCSTDCGFQNAGNIYSFVKFESALVVPIATAMATVSPIPSAKNRSKLTTLSWAATNVPGVTVKRYETQTSTNGTSWTLIASSNSTYVSIKNLRPGTIRYYRVRVVTSLGTSPWSTIVRVRSI